MNTELLQLTWRVPDEETGGPSPYLRHHDLWLVEVVPNGNLDGGEEWGMFISVSIWKGQEGVWYVPLLEEIPGDSNSGCPYRVRGYAPLALDSLGGLYGAE